LIDEGVEEWETVKINISGFPEDTDKEELRKALEKWYNTEITDITFER
jgi:hypothetical protein